MACRQWSYLLNVTANWRELRWLEFCSLHITIFYQHDNLPPIIPKPTCKASSPYNINSYSSSQSQKFVTTISFSFIQNRFITWSPEMSMRKEFISSTCIHYLMHELYIRRFAHFTVLYIQWHLSPMVPWEMAKCKDFISSSHITAS